MKPIILILMACVIFSGCTTSSNVPFCDDLNVTGTDCHSPMDFLDQGSYNYSNAICKELQYIGTAERMAFCFNTLENLTEELRDMFAESMNSYCKSKCWNADDCVDNMSLDGCNYDGCNWCCGDECTLLKCEEKSVNPSEINMYWNGTIEGRGIECVDYDGLNYTTLGISRENFEKLPCYRQRDWLKGWCYPHECNQPNPPICGAVYAVACYNLNVETPKSKYFKHIYLNKTDTSLPEEGPINISKLNSAFKHARSANGQIPEDYIQTVAYETNCQCMDAIRWCEGWDCSCDDYYCYNKSRIVWFPPALKINHSLW